MGFATAERAAFSDALALVGADAPTLCEGWTAYDLAAHCWVRERRPKALLGIASPRFEHLAEEEMARAKEQHGFVELAALLRRTPRTPLTLLPGGDDLVNSAEYFIHTEDVRRANGLPRRLLGADFENMLWKRLPMVGRLMMRGAPCGVVLERSDADASPLRVRPGASTVTVIGRPSELLLFAFGRQSAADVKLVGEAWAMAALKKAKLGA